MATITIVDPVTRIEGHMKVQVTIDTVGGKQQVTDAQCTGTQFRGFEKILVGRDTKDAPYITERICGVCPVSHATAASLRLPRASTAKGRGIRSRRARVGERDSPRTNRARERQGKGNAALSPPGSRTDSWGPHDCLVDGGHVRSLSDRRLMSSRERRPVVEPADLSGLALHGGTQEQPACQGNGPESRGGTRSCPRTVRCCPDAGGQLSASGGDKPVALTLEWRQPPDRHQRMS